MGRVLSKRLALLGVFLVVIAGTIFFWQRSRLATQNTQNAPIGKSKTIQQNQKRPSEHIRFIATGDFIPHDAINLRAKKSDGSYDYAQFMTAMQPFFAKANLRFCNQAVPSGGKAYGISGYPVFNSPLEIITTMAGLGCNVINTGTNHTNDKGQNVINAELDEWDKQSNILAVAGANRSNEEQQRIRYFSQQGVKFAFLSYSTYSNSPNPNAFSLNRFDESLVSTQMQAARTNADIVIVSMRWGTEYSPNINPSQDQTAQKLSDMGADIVLGHGPHVLEPVKRLTSKDGRETLVWFSLGNFLSAQIETEALNNCLAIMDIDTTSKKLTSASCLPIYMHYEWTAEQKAKQDLLARSNFQLLPLDVAGTLLAKSQLHTTMGAQQERIKNILNTYTSIPLISSAEY